MGELLSALRAGRLARRIRREKLTYLSFQKLASLHHAIDEARDVRGAVVECGLALGGSGIMLATKLGDRDFHGYDVFSQIPPPGPDDPSEAHERYSVIESGKSEGLGGETYYGYVDDLYGAVSNSFARFGVPTGERVHLHKGLFEDTLDPTWPISLAHIDCDWYEPVRMCLERITPHLSVGGILVLDDYFDYGGATKATDEFLAAGGFERVRDQGHLVLRRL